MPRIAILADIHGNVPALEATVADIEAQQVDEVLVGGDLVGRGPQGRRVVERIRELGWPTIRGNHEDYLLSFRRGEVPENWLETDEWAASRWMAAELDDDSVRFIEALPFSIRSSLTADLLLVHGSPRSHSDGLGPWSSDEELAVHLQSIGEPILVCAHTHRQMLRQLSDGLVVNVGSVGLPFNGDRRAQYAILEAADGAWRTDLRRVEYDLEQTLAIYESSGFLRQGGITARLLKMELERAAAILVPFLEWARTEGVPATHQALDGFLEVYDPGEPLAAFFRRLRERARRRKPSTGH